MAPSRHNKAVAVNVCAAAMCVKDNFTLICMFQICLKVSFIADHVAVALGVLNSKGSNDLGRFNSLIV